LASAGDRTPFARSSSPYPDTKPTELPRLPYMLVDGTLLLRDFGPYGTIFMTACLLLNVFPSSLTSGLLV
jgi:hypothetical protein